MNSNKDDISSSPGKRNPKKRRRSDILLALLTTVLPPDAKHQFETEVLPMFTLSGWAKEEITEQEYQIALEKVRSEAPFFARFLRDYPSQGVPFLGRGVSNSGALKRSGGTGNT